MISVDFSQKITSKNLFLKKKNKVEFSRKFASPLTKYLKKKCLKSINKR